MKKLNKKRVCMVFIPISVITLAFFQYKNICHEADLRRYENNIKQLNIKIEELENKKQELTLERDKNKTEMDSLDDKLIDLENSIKAVASELSSLN